MIALRTKAATAKSIGITPERLDAQKIRYDLGKYQPGAQKRLPKDPNFTRAAGNGKVIWYEHRRDSDGPYIVLYTIRREA